MCFKEFDQLMKKKIYTNVSFTTFFDFQLLGRIETDIKSLAGHYYLTIILT